MRLSPAETGFALSKLKIADDLRGKTAQIECRPRNAEAEPDGKRLNVPVHSSLGAPATFRFQDAELVVVTGHAGLGCRGTQRWQDC